MEEVLAGSFLDELPARLIGDKASARTRSTRSLPKDRIELIAPNRRGRKLRRYRRRWKVERLFAWMHNFRRLIPQGEHALDHHRT
jgi:transposase